FKDVLRRFNLPIDKCHGQCYDGAANMKGKHSGLQALVRQEEPRVLHVHCVVHVLNLVLQDMSQRLDMCRDFLGVITDLINFVMSSPKRTHVFQECEQDDENASL
uniref:hypothetical protein n=1 Tax=Bradyrhizobium sp. 33ap4 TaxID=3061630 RepID=UPI00292E9092